MPKSILLRSKVSPNQYQRPMRFLCRRKRSLNPIETLLVNHPLEKPGKTVGSDFVGVVVLVGQNVPQSKLKVGHRVGSSSQDTPDSVSLQEMAGMNLVELTAAKGIWHRSKLEAPFAYDKETAYQEHSDWFWRKPLSQDDQRILNIFVYSASTSVRLFAAKMI
ncbi:hypothetical protein CC78DRAFT_587889 [Lojkania enalia]|uniref:Uncharacterized protein n=1 Tax=Lojkania enalia TaxID=147567 RepID=A0A9P4N456_9PLEO|nr:hypothetical protein CC78DRAFT_587889 [Didymosphaeria enalia]